MIQLCYTAHSSVLITCGATKLIFDPWLKGSAYHKQWFVWPLPVHKPEEIDVDVILITHGHEDHLHPETLRAMKKKPKVFFSFQWRAGITKFLRHIGFNEIVEAISFKTYKVNDVKITYISFSLESVVIVEYKDEVIININDALNSNHENAVNYILKEIKLRWPKITYLLSGWSGASYFPNQVRYPGKNNEEIGKLREQYFANNLCRFTKILGPQNVIPFAPGFVLLSKENLWINHIKFSRLKLDGYYKEHYDANSNVHFLIPFPGDAVENGVIEKISHLHTMSEQDAYGLVYTHYAKDIEAVNTESLVEDKEVDILAGQLDYWINFNKKLYHNKVIEDVFFSIRLKDCAHNNYLNVSYKDKKLQIERSEFPLEDRRILVTTSAARMLYALKKEWGGDILTIGYGLLVEVYEQLTLEKNLDIVCIRLITRYPIARQDLIKFPARALRFYTYNPKLTSLWIKQKIVLKPYVNKYPYNERDHWMSYNKCDLCAVCKMPEIDLSVY